MYVCNFNKNGLSYTLGAFFTYVLIWPPWCLHTKVKQTNFDAKILVCTYTTTLITRDWKVFRIQHVADEILNLFLKKK
jgi:hypothetical protein